MKNEKYVPTKCWCWSPIKGARLNPLKNSMTLHEIEEYVKENDAVLYYKNNFYESVHDVPWVQEYEVVTKYGLQTGYIQVAPKLDIVPKGSYIKWNIHGIDGFWVFPDGTV